MLIFLCFMWLRNWNRRQECNSCCIYCCSNRFS